MDNKIVERFWEHPTRYILGLFLVVTALCTLLTIMPKWFNAVCVLFLLAGFLAMIIKWLINELKGQKNTQ